MKYKLSYLLFTFFFLLSTNYILAQHFVSPSYIIDWGNFNITSGQKNSANYTLTDTVGQNSPGRYDSTGYIVKSGFQYIYDTFYQFSFTIDNLNLNLGTLVAGVGSTTSNIISITTPSGQGYQIMIKQNHPLSQRVGTTIPDTACNASSCNVSTSGIWSLSNVYGFGFNAIGINSSGATTNIGTSSYFTDNTYYRPFSSTTSQTIMSSNSPAKSNYARISYKANISAIQSAGFYQNAVIFTAVPKY